MEKVENDVEIVGVRQDDSNCRKGVNCAYYGELFKVYWRSVAWRVLCAVSKILSSIRPFTTTS